MAKNEDGSYVKAQHARKGPSKAVRRLTKHTARRLKNFSAGSVGEGLEMHKPGSQNPRKLSRA